MTHKTMTTTLMFVLGFLALSVGARIIAFFAERFTSNKSTEDYETRSLQIHWFKELGCWADKVGNMTPRQFVLAVMANDPDYMINYPVKEGGSRYFAFISDTAERWTGRQTALTTD